ncbi:MAG: hypothetical protein AB7E51_15865 [Pseudodesulfovibrio sp.]|jgi:hypothetical protein|uniref:Uncharacterized protein n=1 Tax=Pseudodesulfovibrio indicus TaxID=1716143 RepID=A0A126QKP0_9BACT|nr:hypothetical protein [Pseudodesulfovibrio indicus]AMK10613.1 hypothetical protein AWY79_05550 [Pseudodesulfovibrio indicus]TDT82709.1 hypothetical protein EDC59_11621 [Pseudodesulfovibrio indicus]
MYIELDTTQIQGSGVYELLPEDPAHESIVGPAGDLVEISKEAIKAFREAAIEPIKNGTFTLDRLEQRINTVRAEIAHIWNSALPDEEKYLQISARQNEIALLQAGQFTFAKAGFPLSV